MAEPQQSELPKVDELKERLSSCRVGENNEDDAAVASAPTKATEPAVETDLKTPPAAFICPLTLDIMKDPVMDRDGHTYERRAILEWLERGNEVCPLTRKPMRMSDLIPNRSLQCKIEEWRRSQGDDLSVSEDDDEEYDRPFVGIINLPLELQGKFREMETNPQSQQQGFDQGDLSGGMTLRWDGHPQHGYPIVLYYIPDEDHILELIQRSAAQQQRLAEECMAEERCLTITYVALLCSLFTLFAIVIFILYQLLLESNDN